MNEKGFLLGVLGGLGPMSTVYFCELLTAHTDAVRDADHIDMIISSRASTPDRTAFILGKSHLDPLPAMIGEAERLTRAGADLIVIPCNTAHYFYDGLKAAIDTPMLNIIEETLAQLSRAGVRKFGLLATEGTVRAGAYSALCGAYGLECLTPDDADQRTVTSIIYDRIKQNKPVDMGELLAICDRLRARGCERLVLGCTELSLLKKLLPDEQIFVDSLEVLAYQTILAANKSPIGFPADFSVRTEEIK